MAESLALATSHALPAEVPCPQADLEEPVAVANAADVGRESGATSTGSAPLARNLSEWAAASTPPLRGLRRWIQWGTEDRRNTVTVLGGIALGLLVVMRGGTPQPTPNPASMPDAAQLSREVQAIERLSKTPLRLAAGTTPVATEASTASGAAPAGTAAASDSLFEVKMLRSPKEKSAAADRAVTVEKPASTKELATAGVADQTQNRQAADVRAEVVTQEVSSRPVSAEGAADALAVPPGEMASREKTAKEHGAGDEAYPRTDAAKYPAYRFGDSQDRGKDQRP